MNSGCWCSDPINYYLGRRGTIFISAVFCLLTPIGGAVTQSWEELFITRILMGIGFVVPHADNTIGPTLMIAEWV